MSKVLRDLYLKSDKNKAKDLSRFFKTGKGQYGEGDKFLGIMVPVTREIARKYQNASRKEIELLLKNKYHEVRLAALFILVLQYRKSDKKNKKNIFDFYLKNTKYINNWDLVDLSAPYILGDYLKDKKDKRILIKLANSNNLWEQRIAIVSTSALIRDGDTSWTIKIAKMFLSHEHDLIHKATGWMLREVGKKNVEDLYKFLNSFLSKIPRTMLRYSIERFPEKVRKQYLKKPGL